MFIVLLLGVYTGIYLLALDIAYVEVVFFSQPIIQSEKGDCVWVRALLTQT